PLCRFCLFLFYYDDEHLYFYSFPTRRSSDLILKNNYLTRFLHHNILYFCFPGLILFGYLFLRDSRIRKIACLPLLAFIPLILVRSEEHTSELQSREKLVCRFLVEKTID